MPGRLVLALPRARSEVEELEVLSRRVATIERHLPRVIQALEELRAAEFEAHPIPGTARLRRARERARRVLYLRRPKGLDNHHDDA